MQCQSFREAVSARLDGEPLGLDADALDRHLDSCAACAAWEERAADVTRRVRVTPAPEVPDLTAAVLAALPAQRRPAATGDRAAGTAGLVAGWGLRALLGLVGFLQALLAWPVVADGTMAMTGMQSTGMQSIGMVHIEHETGAWNIAVAVAFLAVAAAPRLAAGALPFLSSFAVLLTVLTVQDLGAGHVHADRAVSHVLLLLGVALVALVAWRGRRRRGDVVPTPASLGAPA
jgi:predicted anti-sigma-YlaC factor YlaD